MPPRLLALATAVVAAIAVAAALIIPPADHRPAPTTTAAAKPAAFHPTATPRAVRARRARAARALGAAGVVSTDRRTGGVRFAGRLDGFLTGRSDRDALAKRVPRLIKTAKFRIPAGQSRKVKMRLTAAGRAQLRHKRKLVVNVRVTVRAGGTIIDQHAEKLVFRKRR